MTTWAQAALHVGRTLLLIAGIALIAALVAIPEAEWWYGFVAALLVSLSISLERVTP